MIFPFVIQTALYLLFKHMVQLQSVTISAFYPSSIITSHGPSGKRQNFLEMHVLLLFNDEKPVCRLILMQHISFNLCFSDWT